MTSSLSPELFRVIDANLNRLREGIRVIEDIIRYRDNNKDLALKLKELRHKSRINQYKELLQNRDSVGDVLKTSTKSELERKDITTLLIANFKRAQESSRVLEELFKLESIEYSENFKSIRYQLYNLEKEIILKQK